MCRSDVFAWSNTDAFFYFPKVNLESPDDSSLKLFSLSAVNLVVLKMQPDIKMLINGKSLNEVHVNTCF